MEAIAIGLEAIATNITRALLLRSLGTANSLVPPEPPERHAVEHRVLAVLPNGPLWLQRHPRRVSTWGPYYLQEASVLLVAMPGAPSSVLAPSMASNIR